MALDKKKIEEELTSAILNVANEQLNQYEFLDDELLEQKLRLAYKAENFAFIFAEQIELAIVNRRQKYRA